jgi:hypothetical protein
MRKTFRGRHFYRRGVEVATGAASVERGAQRCGGLPHHTGIVGSATERVPRHAPEIAQNRGFAPIRRDSEAQIPNFTLT